MIRADFEVRRGGFRLAAGFEVPASGVTGVFGPSGCGKTTLLRAIAGLPPHAAGRLEFAGQTWLDSPRRLHVPTHLRRVGLVFQHAALFPHLTVEGNLAYARRRANHAPPNGHDADLVERAGIGHLLTRGTGSLSGGERQRVAIARALAARPRLLLMDEPLSSLDHDSRGSFLAFLESLCESASIPVLYVSHSVDEIARLSARVVVLECGRVSTVLTRDEFLARRNPVK